MRVGGLQSMEIYGYQLPEHLIWGVYKHSQAYPLDKKSESQLN